MYGYIYIYIYVYIYMGAHMECALGPPSLPSLRGRRIGTRLVWEDSSTGSIHRPTTASHCKGQICIQSSPKILNEVECMAHPSGIDQRRELYPFILYIYIYVYKIYIYTYVLCGLFFRYVEAKEIETKLIGFLNRNWRNLSRAKAASLPIFLRRFTTFEVLMRCTMHGAGVLERQKKYAIAISWQRFLLKTPELKPFCSSHRGALWDRLALNLDAHMKEREEALREIEEGMNDDAVATKDKLMLQVFYPCIYNIYFKDELRCRFRYKEICGIVLSKDLGDSRVNRFVLNDTDGHCVECSVEEVVRKYYIEYEGFSSGVHAEGSIWHTVLGMLFYDIIFDNSVKNVWFSELQTNPIDLNSKSLYDNRRERFDERFKWIESATEEELAEIIRTTWHAERNVETSEINWELFQDVEDFLVGEFFFCCPRLGLLSVLKRIVMDYRNCRSGFPDLTMWNTPTKTIAVVEVKGPGDRLSTKQRLWLDFFTRQNIRAEVCHVIGQ
uniref:Fanconi-associated nuclease n=1 Tax=Angiostrongylus cantonensis TaxID=6313 RepID=A0A0K0DH29_ANGCA